MRLKISRNSADERLVALLNQGYEMREAIGKDHRAKFMADSYKNYPRGYLQGYKDQLKVWGEMVTAALKEIFPTELEARTFVAHTSFPSMDFSEMDAEFGRLYQQSIPLYLERLREIRSSDLDRYTDMPAKERLYVEDVDSFSRVRDINPSEVRHLLSGGHLDLLEDQVQMALEQILSVPFHRKDWGGEINDLYTANVQINGARHATAFLLKGRGIGKKEMTIADCGKNGDQLVRLFSAPADLYVVQFVGPVSDAVITDLASKAALARSKGKPTTYLVMDGQDTARVLLAYGKLPAATE